MTNKNEFSISRFKPKEIILKSELLKNKNTMAENNFKPGDKVKINVKSFEWQEKELTPKFLKYINDNMDTIFTLKEYQKGRVLWTFEEDDTWLFYFGNLIKA